MKNLNPRVFSILLIALMGVSVVLFLTFLFGPSTPSGTPSMTNAIIGWCYILLGIAVAGLLFFAVMGIVQNFKGSIRTLIGIGLLLLLFFIGIGVSSDEAMKIGQNVVDGGIARMSEAGLFTFYSMIILAVLTIIYTEVSKAFK